MKRMTYGAAILAAAICATCGKNDPQPASTPSEQPRINLTTDIAGLTRTPQLDEEGRGSFAQGDVFSLYVHLDAKKAAALDYTVGRSTIYWKDLDFATEGAKVNFEACYPKQTLSEGGFDFTTSQDEAGDLLWASAAGVSVGTEKPVELTFRHALHRLTVKYTVEDSSVDAAKIETSCTACATARVELPEKQIKLGDTKKTFTKTGGEVHFLILPQQTENVTLEIRTGASSKTWKLSETDFAQPALEGGKQVTVNLKIQNGQITFAGSTIEGWGDQGSVDDQITL